MNRRELLQAGASALASVGMTGDVLTLNAAKPQAIVLRVACRIERWQIEQIGKRWKANLSEKGSPLADVPIIVLDSIFTGIEIVDQDESGRMVIRQAEKVSDQQGEDKPLIRCRTRFGTPESQTTETISTRQDKRNMNQ